MRNNENEALESDECAQGKVAWSKPVIKARASFDGQAVGGCPGPPFQNVPGPCRMNQGGSG